MFSQLQAKPAEFHVFDTTLRDGSQQEGLNLSVADKLAITGLLDELGVNFIEGGWPGANPGDTAYFAAMADGAVALRNASLVAFGFTRRVGMTAADDPLMPFTQWMELDMAYIDRWSLWLDLKLIARTFVTVPASGSASATGSNERS